MPTHSKHRVYLPATAKSNQYLLAELKVDETFYANYPDAASCYQQISTALFRLADEAGLFNVHMIANDKLPVVRYHQEALSFQTEKQILFFYDPACHEAQNLYAKEGDQARKLRFLFLATGSDIRAHAASFHQQVVRTLGRLTETLPGNNLAMKIRDHQHLSYDLFTAAKGHKETYGYKLRGLPPRYEARGCTLPASHSAISYVTVNLPLTRQLKQKYLQDGHSFASLYLALEECFQKAAADKRLSRIAMVANGLTPLVRNSQVDKTERNNELQKISFDPDAEEQQFHAYWDATNLVETAHFIIVAGKEDQTEMGYGYFMNRVEEALKAFAKQLALDPLRNDLIVRFHQHISYMA